MVIHDLETPVTDEEEEEEERDLLPDLYVEKVSSIIFECKFFDNFALVRPATPQFYTAIRKLSLLEFADRFDEFFGDVNEVRDLLRGQPASITVE